MLSVFREIERIRAPRPLSGPAAARPAAARLLARPIGRSKGSSSDQVHLYDTTLRDGMQGQGMSLSAAEKVRVVRALDELGVHFIEAGFPSSNPKEGELFELLADVELEQPRSARSA